MEDFRIVDLNPEDTQLIQQTAKVAYEAAQSVSKIWLPSLEDVIEEVQDGFEREDGISRVMMVGNTVAAWIGAFPLFGKVAEIHPLLVHPVYQKQGLGKRMVANIIDWAQHQGALTLSVSTSDETQATSLSGVDLYKDIGDAIAHFHTVKPHPVGFWLAIGFSIIGVLPDAESKGMPSIMLAKPLSPFENVPLV